MEMAVWELPHDVQSREDLPELLGAISNFWKEHQLAKLAIPEVHTLITPSVPRDNFASPVMLRRLACCLVVLIVIVDRSLSTLPGSPRTKISSARSSLWAPRHLTYGATHHFRRTIRLSLH